MTYFYGQHSTASRLQSHYKETGHFLPHKPPIVPTEFFLGKIAATIFNLKIQFKEKN